MINPFSIRSGMSIKKRVILLLLIVFVPVPSTGWVVASSRAENDVTAAVFKVLMPQLVLTLLLTLAAAGAAVGLSRPITRSLDLRIVKMLSRQLHAVMEVKNAQGTQFSILFEK